MGRDPGVPQDDPLACSYALQAPTSTATGRTVTLGWVGLTGQEITQVSVERLAQGQDVDDVMSHESIHNALMHSTPVGLAQLVLTVLASPVQPPGVVVTTSRKTLATLTEAARRPHEICATVWPQIGRESSRTADYWRTTPASNAEIAGPVARWIAASSVPVENQRRLVYGLAQYALGCSPPMAALTDPRTMRTFLSASRDPGRRFDAALAAVTEMSATQLAALARADDVAAGLAALPALAAGPYTAVPAAYGKWALEFCDALSGVCAAWRDDARVTEEERRALPLERAAGLMFLQPPGPPMMSAILTQTVAADATYLGPREAPELLPYALCQVTWNSSGGPLGAYTSPHGSPVVVGHEEAALWLHHPDMPPAIALARQGVLRDYVERLGDDRTLCVSDAFYIFPRADLLASEPVLRGRRHLVVVRRRSLAGLLGDPLLAMGLASEKHLEVTTWNGSSPGVAYVLIRPAAARAPVIVAPVPTPTAEAAVRELRAGSIGSDLRWSYVKPDRFIGRDVRIGVDLIRFCLWFEDQPWPAEYRPAPLPTPGGGTTSRASAPAGADPGGLGPPPTGAHGGDALARLPDSTRLLLDAGGSYEVRGKARKAAEFYRRMTTEGNATDRAAGWLALGFLEAHRDHLRECEQAWRAAVAVGHPDLSPLALLYLGSLCERTYRGMEAVALYSQVVGLRHPEHSPPAAFGIARLLLDKDQTEVASALLTWVVRSGHPDVAPAAEALLRDVEARR